MAMLWRISNTIWLSVDHLAMVMFGLDEAGQKYATVWSAGGQFKITGAEELAGLETALLAGEKDTSLRAAREANRRKINRDEGEDAQPD